MDEPADEMIRPQGRFAALRATELLDSAPEPAFDRVTRLVTRQLNVPVALVSLVDDDRQLLKSCVGLPEPWASARQIPLSRSICRHVVAGGEPLVIPDAREVPLLQDSPAISELDVVAYLGVPVTVPTGEIVGSLCAIDSRPREWTSADLDLLTDLSQFVTTEIELHGAGAVAARHAADRDRRLLATVMRSATDAILTTDLKGRVTSWNPGAQRLFGYGAAEILGHPVIELSPESDRDRTTALFDQAEVEGHVVVPAAPRQRKSGEIIHVSLSVSRLVDEAGVALGFVGIARDVSEQHRLVRELADAEERNRALLGSLPDTMLALYDRELRCVMLEGPILRRTGIDPSAYLGRSVTEIQPAGDAAELERLTSAVRRGLEGDTVDITYRSPPTGGVYEGSVVPYRSADGTVAGAFVIVRDVTERRRAEHELRERERMLAESQAVAHVGSWEWNLSGQQQRWSDELCRIFGQPLGFSPTTAEFLALVHPDDHHLVADRVHRTRAGEASKSAYRIVRPDGAVRHVHTSRFARVDDRGEVTHTYGTTQDITERVAREQEVRQLAAIVEQSADAIVTKDRQGVITQWNRGAERLYGYPAHEALGQPISMIVPADRRGEENDLLARALAGETVEQHQTARVRKDGRRLGVSITVSPLRDGNGQAIGALVITRDVSDQQRAEREREQALRALAEAQRIARVGSWSWDPVRREASWSAEMYRIFGRAETEGPAIDSALFALVHPDDRTRVVTALAAAAGQKSFELDLRLLRADGRERVIDVRGRQERADRYVGTVQDVTGLRAAEREARAAEKRFANTLESAPIGIALVSPDGRWLQVNRALCAIVGYTEAELLKLSFQDITHPDDVATDVANRDRLVRGEITHYRVEKRYVHKSGKLVWVELSVSLLRDEHGEPVHFISQLQDISERREYEAALRDSREQALAASRLKSEFVANMSHEIRTPLNGVVSMAQLLLGSELTPEQRRYAQISATSSRALMRIVDDILDFSKIEAGKLEIVDDDYELRQVVDDVCTIVGVAAREKGVELSWAIAPEVAAYLHGDAGRLRQVLFNLVGNAVKFTDEGSVEVGARTVESERARRLRLEVTDTGIGLSGDQIARLFEPFTQADASATRRHGGTGLGLSIAKQLVELMGGNIGAEGVPGAGSTFWLELPYRPGRRPSDTPDPIPPWAPSAVGSSSGRHRLLVAEDNEINQFTATRIFNRLGFEVDIAANGREALELLSRRRYAAIFMDCQMPELDGYQTTREIRRREGAGPHVPIIAMTASTMAGDRERCLAAGMNDYVSKPLPLRRLTEICRRLIPMSDPAPEPSPAAAPTAPQPASAAFDPGLLEGMAGSGEIVEILDVFLVKLRADQERLDEAIARDDEDAIGRTAHHITGSAASIGAAGVAEAARAVGRCPAGQPDRLRHARQALDEAADAAGDAIRAYIAAARR